MLDEAMKGDTRDDGERAMDAFVAASVRNALRRSAIYMDGVPPEREGLRDRLSEISVGKPFIEEKVDLARAPSVESYTS